MNPKSYMDLSDLFRSDRIHAAFSLKTFKHKGNERKLLSSLINLDPNRIVNPQQVHSSKVKIVDEPGKILSTDGIISSSKSLVLSIQVADCIPLYLADPVNNVIGIVHAGWKGIEKGGDITRLQSIANKTVFSNKTSINHSKDIFEIKGGSSDIISFLLQMAEKKQIQKFNFSEFYDNSGQFNLKVQN